MYAAQFIYQLLRRTKLWVALLAPIEDRARKAQVTANKSEIFWIWLV